MSEEDLWTFDRNDFEKACIFLVFNVTGKNFTRQDQRMVSILIQKFWWSDFGGWIFQIMILESDVAI